MSSVTHCNLNPRYISTISEQFFSNKKSVRPLAIITYGPTGSGKSVVLKSFLKTNETKYTSDDFIEINIDSLVEAINHYKTNVSTALDDETRTKIYFSCREEVDELSSLLFYKAIANKNNLIYETTGSSVKWLKGDLQKLRESGYIIVVIYPFVTWNILNKRLTDRERTSVRKIDRTLLKTNVGNAIKNFFDVIPSSDYAYIYDNTGSAMDVMPIIISYDGTISHNKFKPKITCNSKELSKILSTEDDREILNLFQKYFIANACGASSVLQSNLY